MNFFLAFCLIAVTSIYGASARNVCQKDTVFDIALLSVQWVPGVCASKSCSKYGNEFSIHGMWPNYKDNTYPETCCFQPYLEKSALAPIMEPLNKYWRSLYGQSNFDFWIHEWKKHGTCAEKSALKGQFNYFNTTLKLFTQLKLASWLNAAGIRPSESPVSLETVRDALEKGFGGRPQISCSGKRSGNSILTEIRLCYDPNTLVPMDCPEENNSCKAKIVILSA